MVHLTTLSVISDFDFGLAKFANDLLHLGGDFLTSVMRIITLMGNGGIAFIIIGLILLLCKKTRSGATAALIAMIFGFLLTNLLFKNIFMRPRPFLDVDSVYFTWWNEAGSLPQGGYSFPSGHATVAITFSFPLFLYFKKKFSWLFLFIPLVMGFTRIYFQVHYATDVLGGFAVGIACGVGGYFVYKALLKLPFFLYLMDLPSITTLFRKKAI